MELGVAQGRCIAKPSTPFRSGSTGLVDWSVTFIGVFPAGKPSTWHSDGGSDRLSGGDEIEEAHTFPKTPRVVHQGTDRQGEHGGTDADEPPRARPETSTAISIAVRTRRSGSPRAATPVIEPSRGPGPSPAPMYITVPMPKAGTPRPSPQLPGRLVGLGQQGRATFTVHPMSTALRIVRSRTHPQGIHRASGRSRP